MDASTKLAAFPRLRRPKVLRGDRNHCVVVRAVVEPQLEVVPLLLRDVALHDAATPEVAPGLRLRFAERLILRLANHLQRLAVLE